MPGSNRIDSPVLDPLEWIGFIKRHRSTGNGPLVSASAGDAHYLRTQRRGSP